MKTKTLIISFLLGLFSSFLSGQTTYSNFDNFKSAVANAIAGDEIILAAGSYQAESITLNEINGTADNPIIIRSEQIGADTLNEGTYFDFRNCSHIIIQGFVINISEKSTTFKIQASNNIRITQNVFNGENEAYYKDDGVSRNSSVWISIQGLWNDAITLSHHNQIDHNLFMNKHTLGNMIRIDGTNELYVSQYDMIEYNHFYNMGPRATNEMEVIRVGWSAMSESDGHAQITNNLFEECNGDPEIISVKCNKNTVAHNTFRRCQGTLSLRHGNESLVEGNFFFGEGAEGTGGVRFYGSDHVIINNYFEGLTGTRWDAPITLTEGDAEEGNSGLSKHFRIERAVIANNTLVNNTHGIELGYDNSGKYSKPPRDVVMAYNAIVGDTNAFVKYINEPDNISWIGNIALATDDAILGDGVTFISDEMNEINPEISYIDSLGYYKVTDLSPVYTPASEIAVIVSNDIDGQLRSASTNYGADEFNSQDIVFTPLTAGDVGPSVGDYMYPSVSNLSFEVWASEKSISVMSNLDWQVLDTNSWITVSPISGSGYGRFNITVSENTSGVIRTGEFTLESTNAGDENNISVSVIVSQSDTEPAELTVSKTELELDASAQNSSISLTSNIDWIVETDKEWITVSPESGSINETLIITVEANEELTERSGVVTVSGGELSKSIHISQAGYVGSEEKLVIIAAEASTEQVDEGNVAGNVFDNDLSNRWSGDGDGAFITLDLGQEYKVSFLKVGLYQGDERMSYFDILSSKDNLDYNEALIGISSELTSSPLVIYDFADTTARYIRVVGHGNSESTWNSYTEFEVWGWELDNLPTKNDINLTDLNTKIYPNPTEGHFTITCKQGAEVKILDISGKLVYQQQSLEENHQMYLNLEKGMYYIVLKDGIKKDIKKLVIK